MTILDLDPPEVTGPPEHLAPVATEQALLGGCLRAPRVLDAVVSLIPDGAVFWLPRHGHVWDAARALWDRGEVADPENVRAELERRGAIREAGGAVYLHTLLAAESGTSVLADPAPYVDRVLDAWQKRGSDAALTRGRQVIAAGDGGTATEILDAVQTEIERAREMRTRTSNVVRVGDLYGGVLSDLDLAEFEEDARGVPAPYRDLAAVLNPAMPGQMIGVAGRPGHGKSTLMKDWCEHASFHLGLPSLLVTYEMRAAEITARVMAHQARVLLSHLTRPGLLNWDDRARLAEYAEAIAAAPLFIVDSEDTSVAEIDRLIRQYRPRLVAIDYLQIAVPEGGRPEHRRAEVERYSRSIKKLAGRREVPVIVGSQLNRASEARKDHRPSLGDLRESGGIEQDCDGVVLLHRPELHDPETTRIGEVDAIVAKQRNGPTDTVPLAARLHYASFADMAT